MDMGANLRSLKKLKSLARQGQDYVKAHPEELKSYVNKAGAAADKQTGGRYHDRIVAAGSKVESIVDKQVGK